MMIAFASIFFVTYNRTHMEITNALNHIENLKPNEDKPPKLLDYSKIQLPLKEGVLPERQVSFVVNMDFSNEITSAYSIFEAEDVFYENAIELIKGKDAQGFIELENDKWAFRIVPRKDFYQVFFVNTTSQLLSLNRLAITFVVALIIMIVVTYIFSRYMTNQAIKPIKEAFDKQNQFISDASHELKTPLAIINTNVDVLLNDSSESEKWLNYIKSEVSRMTKLTENLLYLSQFDDHNTETEFAIVDFSTLCEHVLLGMDAVAYERKRELIYDIKPNINVQGDSEQLSQALLILLDNAIKYSDENSIIHIKLEVIGHIQLSVTNVGPGISEGDIQNIFDRFYKTDSSRSKYTGYGLGLSIANSIINNHKGEISCKSQLNHTTTFTIKLLK